MLTASVCTSATDDSQASAGPSCTTTAIPITGEIYVIAVDPDFHGQGLGKQLTIAGLDSITARGVSNAILYVDAANTPAVALYEGLGFAVHKRRRAFSSDTTATISRGAS